MFASTTTTFTYDDTVYTVVIYGENSYYPVHFTIYADNVKIYIESARITYDSTDGLANGSYPVDKTFTVYAVSYNGVGYNSI